MVLPYIKGSKYVAGLLGFIIISSLLQTPRFTLKSFKSCEKSDINIVYKFGHTEAWDKHGRYNELNTFHGTYMKDMVTEGTLTARLCLTSEELEAIYYRAVEINFFNYPKHSPQSNGDKVAKSSHMYRHILEISNGSVNNSLQWYSVGLQTGDEWVDKIISLSRFIMEIVENKPEYQDMPEPNAGYV